MKHLNRAAKIFGLSDRKPLVADKQGQKALMLTKEEIYPALEKLHVFEERLDSHKEHVLNLCKKV